MSVLDNALQQLFKDGVKIKKLWTNASPLSQFAAQHITIARAGFDYIGIQANWNNASTDNVELVALVENKVGKATEFYGTELATYAAGTFTIAKRNVAVIDKGLSIGNGLSGQAEYGDSRPYWFIPTIVYGIKLLGGALRKAKKALCALLRRKEALA